MVLNKLQSLLSNLKGATAVEFALVLPVFLTFIFATIEFGYIYRGYMVLQNAAQEAARLAMTGHNYDTSGTMHR